MEMMNPREIKTHKSFEALFPIRPELLGKIENDMREGTYDISQPIILATWEGQKEPVCIDGHTRVKAAINAEIENVPVFTHEYDDEQEALEKAIRLQRNRRNITDAEILACVEALDARKPRGGDRRSEEAKSKASSDAIEKPSSKSAQETADLLGISTTKVERTRAVLDHGDPDMREAVKNGEVSINKACNETRKKRKKSKSLKEKTASQTTNCRDASADVPAEPLAKKADLPSVESDEQAVLGE